MDASQRTESRVDQWPRMVIRYNAIRLTSQQVDPAGGCRSRGLQWTLAGCSRPAGKGRQLGSVVMAIIWVVGC